MNEIERREDIRVLEGVLHESESESKRRGHIRAEVYFNIQLATLNPSICHMSRNCHTSMSHIANAVSISSRASPKIGSSVNFDVHQPLCHICVQPLTGTAPGLSSLSLREALNPRWNTSSSP